MAFRDDVFKQAGGRCQCIMKACSQHTGRCNAMLRGDWEMHRTTSGGAYTLSSVKAMCQTCHRKNAELWSREAVNAGEPDDFLL